MVGFVRFEIKVPVRLHREGDWMIASCDMLDVHSQGEDENRALSNLTEALQLFLETCYERGTLDEVLLEQGFVPGEPPEASEMPWLSVPVSLIARSEPNHAH